MDSISNLVAKVKTDKNLARAVFNYGEQHQDGAVSRQCEMGLQKHIIRLEPTLDLKDNTVKTTVFDLLLKSYQNGDYTWVHESVSPNKEILKQVVTAIATDNIAKAESLLKDIVTSKMRDMLNEAIK